MITCVLCVKLLIKSWTYACIFSKRMVRLDDLIRVISQELDPFQLKECGMRLEKPRIA
jgi:hypothetical protein